MHTQPDSLSHCAEHGTEVLLKVAYQRKWLATEFRRSEYSILVHVSACTRMYTCKVSLSANLHSQRCAQCLHVLTWNGIEATKAPSPAPPSEHLFQFALKTVAHTRAHGYAFPARLQGRVSARAPTLAGHSPCATAALTCAGMLR